jgi:hypothetical protein
VTVADESECACDGRADELKSEAEKLRADGNGLDAKAIDAQIREVEQACSARGEYEWEEQGFVPAGG